MSLIQQPDREPDLEVVIYGVAKTKGSTRSFVPKKKGGQPARRPDGRLLVITKNDAGPDAEIWAGSIAKACAEQMEKTGLNMTRSGGVWIELVFYRPRNKGHFGTGKNAAVLKDSAPAYPDVKPDIDKLARCALDALKGIVWNDDGQVVAMPTFKTFGDPARLEMRFWQLSATVADLNPKLDPLSLPSQFA